jgi:hypothetical protein
VRRVIVRARRAHDGGQYEDVVPATDAGVRVVFGERITAYDWMYVSAPDKVPGLAAALGGTASDDILALVADLDRRERGGVHPSFTSAAA